MDILNTRAPAQHAAGEHAEAVQYEQVLRRDAHLRSMSEAEVQAMNLVQNPRYTDSEDSEGFIPHVAAR